MEYGGLGISDLEKYNRALRCHWLWLRWTDNEKLWRDLPLPIDEQVTALFQASTTIEIGDGSKISFWNDTWLGNGCPSKLFPDLFKHNKNKNCSLKEGLHVRKCVSVPDDRTPPAEEPGQDRARPSRARKPSVCTSGLDWVTATTTSTLASNQDRRGHLEDHG